ncbi:MAG: hypothetical protein ACC633_07870 [Anaerolineales bacterium]
MENRENNQVFSDDAIKKTWGKKFGYSLAVLNVYYILRFIITFWNSYQTINIQSKVVLLGLIFTSLIITYFSIKPRYINFLIDYFTKERAIYELFIVFLFSTQILKFLKQITSSVAFEFRGWFISNYIWIVLIYCIVRIIKESVNSAIIRQTDVFSFRNVNHQWIFKIGLLLISSIIIGYWIYTQFINPLPNYFNYDPEYQYMLNATTPFKDSELYQRMDHPGSLIQLLGTLFSVFLSPLTFFQSGFPTYINITHPGYFIFISRLFILLLNIGTITILALKSIKIFHLSDIFAALSISLIYFSSHRLSLEFTAIWSPNSFNFALGSILFLFLLLYLTSEKVDPKKLRFISLAAGLIGTFHVYMVTWSIGISTAIFLYYLFTTKDLKRALLQWIQSLLNFLKGYLIGTLVIINHFGSFLDWIFEVVTHQGIYGGGQIGFTSSTQIISNLQSILKNTPEILLYTSVLIIWLLVLFVFSWKKISEYPGVWATALGVIIQILLLSILILKHPRGGRYLLSIAALLPTLLTTIILISRSLFKSRKFLFPVIFTVLFFSFCWTVIFNGNRHLDRNQYIVIYQKEIQRFISEYAQSHNLQETSIEKYWVYGSYSECYALWFANDSAKKIFTKEINEICSKSNDFSYNYWSKEIFPADENRSLSNLDQYSIIIGDPKRLDHLILENFHEFQSPTIDNLSFYIRSNNNH